MNSWLKSVAQRAQVKISSSLTWALPRPFYSPVNHTFGQPKEKKKRGRNQCSPRGSFSTCQGKNQRCHLSAWSAEQGPEISPGATQIPSPATIQNNLGSHQPWLWAWTPCSALETDLRAQKIPWLPTFPGSGTTTEQILGWGEHPGHCKAQREGS